MPLTAAEKKLAAAIGFDEDVCEIVKEQTDRALDRLTAFTEGYEPEDADGLSVALDRQHIERVIGNLQLRLAPRGYRAFWSEICEASGLKKSEEIVVLKTTDQYSIIQIRRSNGGNYGISTDDIMTTLKTWENRCKFEIFGAGGAWVAIQFETIPDNICAFAEEIYDFCPDTVEQGVGLTNESDDPEAWVGARCGDRRGVAMMRRSVAGMKSVGLPINLGLPRSLAL